MNDATLIAALAPEGARLLDRHLSTARAWYPHELVPWQRVLDPPLVLDEPTKRALIVNLLTEDNVPYYVMGVDRQLGGGAPWWDWLRRWAAEEMRHATVIRDYLAVTRAVDLVALEQARLAHVSHASVPTAAGAPEALVYLTLQELATRIAHGNTGTRLDDDGRRIMHRVAADEHLHHLFYRDLVSAALELDASRMVIAIDEQVRHFAMPGTAMAGFADHARVIAEAGIFSAQILLDGVFRPVVLQRWGIEHLDGLSPAAEAARQRLLQFFERFGRVAGRLSRSSVEPPRGDAAPAAGS